MKIFQFPYMLMGMIQERKKENNDPSREKWDKGLLGTQFFK